ncbi:MAG: histidinol dehydrogenase [Thermoleophilaceae bacterium]|nr:histidinol dehydrogenase [Thermoleophilaceae bacterium]
MPVRRFPTDASAAEIRSLSKAPPSEAVAAIIANVQSAGNDAVLGYEREFAGPDISPPTSVAVVEPQQLQLALSALDPELRAAIELAVTNVRTVAQATVLSEVKLELAQGQSVDLRSVAVGSAGVYVPGGRGSYPSTAVMCIVAAQAAGVERIVVVSPVREHGEVDHTVLAVCELLGVGEVYPIGGAQAVAALALGTETVAPVDLVVGPGNAFVQEAKRQLIGRIGIDGVAGPSELVVVADHSANARHIALDLQAQAEHGPDSLVVVISNDPVMLDQIADEVGDISAELAIALTRDLPAAVALADAIAPEHLQIACQQPLADELARSVTRAGCLFVGHNAATAFGDYVAGSNHVLPTGGAARFTSALSGATFMRRMAQVSIPDGGLESLSQAGAAIAAAEGFNIHGQSMTERAK